MPVANLQSYRTVALRVKSTAFAAQGQARFLEASVLQKLRQQCGFEQVGQDPKSDVVIDLNITQSGRGSGGALINTNVATIDTLLVLSDGVDGELLGTLRIHGKSSGLIINNAPPENEVVEIIAKTVVDTLAKSGCGGPRIAKVEKTPVDPGPGPTTGPVDETKRAEAEALNTAGKEKLYGADTAGALAAFQQANQLIPDARYEFNICLTLVAQEQYPTAQAACQRARGLNPEPKLAAKIDQRLELLAQRK
ncbi:MAG: hypothetical protein ABI867_43900 [Kofleriaceae bacterium]